MFGQKLKLLRNKTEVSGIELAKFLGYSANSMITQWESGAKPPPALDVIKRIAEKLNANVQEEVDLVSLAKQERESIEGKEYRDHLKTLITKNPESAIDKNRRAAEKAFSDIFDSIDLEAVKALMDERVQKMVVKLESVSEEKKERVLSFIEELLLPG